MRTAAEYPYLSLEVKRFIGEEAVDLLPLEGMGLLFRCMLRAWREGSVPAAPADLARLVGTTTKQIERLLPSISAFCVEGDGRLTFPLVEKERKRVTDMLADKSAAGTRSVQKREERKQKRLEYRRKVKERKAVNAVQTGVGTDVPHTHTDIHPHPHTSKKTDPPPRSPAAGAASPEIPVKIETVFDRDGRPAVCVSGSRDSQVNLSGAGSGLPMKQNLYENDVQAVFERTFPSRIWAEEKACVLSACHKYGRGQFNQACVHVQELTDLGKPPQNAVAYAIGQMQRSKVAVGE